MKALLAGGALCLLAFGVVLVSAATIPELNPSPAPTTLTSTVKPVELNNDRYFDYKNNHVPSNDQSIKRFTKREFRGSFRFRYHNVFSPYMFKNRVKSFKNDLTRSKLQILLSSKKHGFKRNYPALLRTLDFLRERINNVSKLNQKNYSLSSGRYVNDDYSPRNVEPLSAYRASGSEHVFILSIAKLTAHANNTPMASELMDTGKKVVKCKVKKNQLEPKKYSLMRLILLPVQYDKGTTEKYECKIQTLSHTLQNFNIKIDHHNETETNTKQKSDGNHSKNINITRSKRSPKHPLDSEAHQNTPSVSHYALSTSSNNPNIRKIITKWSDKTNYIDNINETNVHSGQIILNNFGSHEKNDPKYERITVNPLKGISSSIKDDVNSLQKKNKTKIFHSSKIPIVYINPKPNPYSPYIHENFVEINPNAIADGGFNRPLNKFDKTYLENTNPLPSPNTLVNEPEEQFFVPMLSHPNSHNVDDPDPDPDVEDEVPVYGEPIAEYDTPTYEKPVAEYDNPTYGKPATANDGTTKYGEPISEDGSPTNIEPDIEDPEYENEQPLTFNFDEDCPTVYVTINNTVQPESKTARDCADIYLKINTKIQTKNEVNGIKKPQSDEQGKLGDPINPGNAIPLPAAIPLAGAVPLADVVPLANAAFIPPIPVPAAVPAVSVYSGGAGGGLGGGGLGAGGLGGGSLGGVGTGGAGIVPVGGVFGGGSGLGGADSPGGAEGGSGVSSAEAGGSGTHGGSGIASWINSIPGYIGMLAAFKYFNYGIFLILLGPIATFFTVFPILLAAPWLLSGLFKKEPEKVVFKYVERKPLWDWDDYYKTWHRHSSYDGGHVEGRNDRQNHVTLNNMIEGAIRYLANRGLHWLIGNRTSLISPRILNLTQYDPNNGDNNYWRKGVKIR